MHYVTHSPAVKSGLTPTHFNFSNMDSKEPSAKSELQRQPGRGGDVQPITRPMEVSVVGLLDLDEGIEVSFAQPRQQGVLVGHGHRASVEHDDVHQERGS